MSRMRGVEHITHVGKNRKAYKILLSKQQGVWQSFLRIIHCCYIHLHYSLLFHFCHCINKKSKGVLRQAEVALGVPARLRPRIFSTFGTTRVVGRQPKAPAAFTPGETPGTHFQRWVDIRAHVFFFGRNHGKYPKWHHRGSIPGPPN